MGTGIGPRGPLCFRRSPDCPANRWMRRSNPFTSRTTCCELFAAQNPHAQCRWAAGGGRARQPETGPAIDIGRGAQPAFHRRKWDSRRCRALDRTDRTATPVGVPDRGCCAVQAIQCLGDLVENFDFAPQIADFAVRLALAVVAQTRKLLADAASVDSTIRMKTAVIDIAADDLGWPFTRSGPIRR